MGNKQTRLRRKQKKAAQAASEEPPSGSSPMAMSPGMPPAPGASMPHQPYAQGSPDADSPNPLLTDMKSPDQGDVKLSEVTHFSPREVREIKTYLFYMLGTDSEEDSSMTLQQFEEILGVTGSPYHTERLFEVFKMKGSSKLEISDLIQGLSKLSSHASRDEKLQLSFALLKPDQNGLISRQATMQLLKSTISDYADLGLTLNLTEEQLSAIVEQTFSQLGLGVNSGISLQDYKKLDEKSAHYNNMTTYLTTDIPGVISRIEKARSMRVQ